MDIGELQKLHEDGHHESAWGEFAQMCRRTIYGEHGLPDGVSHLVHYTTLPALMSMLRVTGASAHVLETGGAAKYGRTQDRASAAV